MKYQLAIFDMDGTIIDSRPFHASVFEDFLRENWHPVGYEACYAAVGVTVRTVFESMGIPAEKHDPFFDMLSAYYVRHADVFLEKTSIAEGVVPVLQYMKSRGMKTAVVTNSLDDVVRMFMDYHGIRNLFDVVVGADRRSHSKNERCRAICEEFDAAPNQVLYVGDSESDMVLANDMGYDACFAKTDIAWHKDAAYIADVLKPKYTITSYAALTKLLEAMECAK